ncbi:MAG: hypothetical protein Q7R66_03525 [Undibacterium sp.]|nr:hypothetical protein [Undibacterium sp.]MDO8651240.1 hypothetical protein [Undibacterium sp.]
MHDAVSMRLPKAKAAKTRMDSAQAISKNAFPALPAQNWPH